MQCFCAAVWTDVLPPFSTSAAADTAIAVFGAMSLWWMGEHGSARIDTREHIYFANDQLAERWIKRPNRSEGVLRVLLVSGNFLRDPLSHHKFSKLSEGRNALPENKAI
jgi:hypothetical protein